MNDSGHEYLDRLIIHINYQLKNSKGYQFYKDIQKKKELLKEEANQKEYQEYKKSNRKGCL